MDVRDFLSPDSIVLDLASANKKQVLQALSQRIAPLARLDERIVFDVILERERLGTTGIGKGIAIPHGKIASLERIHGLFARLKPPVDFEALDGEPVDLVFVLLAPAAAGADHLKALAWVSKLLRDPVECEKLRKAPDAKRVFAILTSEAANRAA